MCCRQSGNFLFIFILNNANSYKMREDEGDTYDLQTFEKGA